MSWCISPSSAPCSSPTTWPCDLSPPWLSGPGHDQQKRYMAICFFLQNIAANLGGMVTPFGNPQNLYLYTKFNIPTGEFVSIMLPPFLIAIALITVCCLFIKSEPLVMEGKPVHLDPSRTVLYLALFALAIIIVFRVIPFWVGLIVVPVVLFFADRKALPWWTIRCS